MSILPIKHSVGGRDMPDIFDLNQTRKVFRDFGLYDGDEDGPMVDAPLHKAIKAFQDLRGLKVDGIINPGGETENEIAKIKTGKPSPRYVQNQQQQNDTRENSIGFGGNPLGVLPKEKPERKVQPVPTRKPETPKRNLLEMDVVKPENKPVLSLEERKKAVINNTEKDQIRYFQIVANEKADPKKPWYVIESYSEVAQNKESIEKYAKENKIEPDFIKAIIYLETTQGYYDQLAPKNMNKTIRPMNVHVEYWKELGYSKNDLENNDKNIKVGAELIGRIKRNMPNASDEKVATIYNNLGARKVSDYGARIKKLMKDKPWEKK